MCVATVQIQHMYGRFTHAFMYALTDAACICVYVCVRVCVCVCVCVCVYMCMQNAVARWSTSGLLRTAATQRRIQVHTNTYICITTMYLCVSVCIRICTHSTQLKVCKLIAHAHVCVCHCVCTHALQSTYTCTCVRCRSCSQTWRTHTYIHMHMHVFVYTCIRTYRDWCSRTDIGVHGALIMRFIEVLLHIHTDTCVCMYACTLVS